jgi:glycosyltransferase involved in cell wall biosynthesis
VHTSKVHSGFYGAYQWLYTWLHCWLERHAFDRSRQVIAVSEKIKEELKAIGVPSARIDVIANGVDIQEFSPGPVDRKSLELPVDPPLALFAGDIRTPRKNLDTVLHALVAVPELHLAVAGTVMGSPYPALSASLGIADRVHFLGFRDDIPDLMRAADLFVFPSRYEACTLVLLEAMASGLPVITAETAGGAELVPPEAGLVLNDPDDIAGLEQALQHLVRNPKRRKAMGEVARGVAERHRWEDMARHYADRMEDLQGASRAPSLNTSTQAANAR